MNEEQYIRRCIQLAEKGMGWTEPNPYVGCVIVHHNRIVAEGWHVKFGEAHAEVNAIRKLPEHIPPHECELYVNLEPCSHFGKTPPCANLIIHKGFKKVFIGTPDPNPLVNGKGIRLLKEAGINVRFGICEEECRKLNRKFFYYYEKEIPYITLKWAQTADGFISLRNPVNRSKNKISNPASDRKIHTLRSQHQAILVGKNTVLTDNPRLDVRLVAGRSPLRIVLGYDPEFENLNISDEKISPVIFLVPEIKAKTLNKKNIFPVSSPSDISCLMKTFKSLDIQSILVEGGRTTLNFFLENQTWNQLIQIKSNTVLFYDGIPAPEVSTLPNEILQIKDDVWYLYENKG